MANCPRCEKKVNLSSKNLHRPFCSEKCKLIDFGSWASEDNKISRPIQSEDFYEDWISKLNYSPFTTFNHKFSFFIF